MRILKYISTFIDSLLGTNLLKYINKKDSISEDVQATQQSTVEFADEIKKYKNFLETKNLPVIYSLPHLCLLAGVNISSIINCCNSNRISDYKRFKLMKKRGGFRVIQTPREELKFLQKWILVNILNKVRSHPSCKGFDIKSSINKNAEVHLNCQSILKIDLLRFYDSITERRLFGLFKSIGYHPNLAVSFAKICTIVPNGAFLRSFKAEEIKLKKHITFIKQGVLPQGAPTSPKLSNLISLSLDNRLSKLAMKNNVNYSRYADDITFSGDPGVLQFIKKVAYRIIDDENFFVNHSKTKILIRGNPFFVTGLSVNNNQVTVPKKRKVDIEHHLHHCLKNGVENHLKKCGLKKRNFKDWLFGNIAFVNSVEKKTAEKYFSDFNKIQWPI